MSETQHMRGVAVYLTELTNNEPSTEIQCNRKCVKTNSQALTVWIHGVALTGISISQSAKAPEKVELIEIMTEASLGSTLVIGDMSAGNTAWGTKSNGRVGSRRRWADLNRWTIKPPKGPTVSNNTNTTSTLDVAMRKGIPESSFNVPPISTDKSRVYQSVATTITAHWKKFKTKG